MRASCLHLARTHGEGGLEESPLRGGGWELPHSNAQRWNTGLENSSRFNRHVHHAPFLQNDSSKRHRTSIRLDGTQIYLGGLCLYDYSLLLLSLLFLLLPVLSLLWLLNYHLSLTFVLNLRRNCQRASPSSPVSLARRHPAISRALRGPGLGIRRELES